MVHDMFLMQVKAPAQSTTPWDYYNVVATTKGEDAFTTKAESKCATVEVMTKRTDLTQMEIFGIPIQAFLGHCCSGLVNGSFYAMLSLGLAVIFGLLGIVNFAHGALYMIGAYVAFVLLEKFGINYWFALVLSPLIVGALGVVVERTLLKRLYKIDPIYGLLLTFGLALIAEGVFRYWFDVSGQSYPVPELLKARPTSASWCCRTTAPGSSWRRSRSAWARGS
jgi:hypothetical protein